MVATTTAAATPMIVKSPMTNGAIIVVVGFSGIVVGIVVVSSGGDNDDDDDDDMVVVVVVSRSVPSFSLSSSLWIRTAGFRLGSVLLWVDFFGTGGTGGEDGWCVTYRTVVHEDRRPS